MSFEQDIAAQITASDTLTGLYAGKVSDINQRIAAKDGLIAEFLTTNRMEPGFYRLGKNQRLYSTDGLFPDFWETGPDMTYTHIQEVGANTAWDDRTAIEQEILTAMGRHGVQHIHLSFNIWRMDWTVRDTAHIYTLFQRHTTQSKVTIAAMTKLLSGQIIDNWANGATNEWKLTGVYGESNNIGHTVSHPNRWSTTGSMLFALPATVAGHVPLDLNVWGLFPYIGDMRND